MNITKGKRDFEGGLLSSADMTVDDLRRTYDRLRKQSLRRRNRMNARFGRTAAIEVMHVNYVRGVRESLNAVLREAEDGMV